MSDKRDKAAAGASVFRCWWGREAKNNVVVKRRDFKITIRLIWGRQTRWWEQRAVGSR